jgi:two-component system LytT family response regulator
MESIFSCVVVDDEAAARDLIIRYINRHPNLALCAEFGNASSAINFLRVNVPDIVFLDVDMPGINGLEMLHKIDTSAFNVVFTTGFSEYALDAMDADIKAFLLKPFSYEKFSVAVERTYQRMQNEKSIVIKDGSTLHRIFLKEITWIEADNYYVKIYRKSKSALLVRMSLQAIGLLLPENTFIKASRSSLVSVSAVVYYEGSKAKLIDGREIKISRSKRDHFYTAFRFSETADAKQL